MKYFFKWLGILFALLGIIFGAIGMIDALHNNQSILVIIEFFLLAFNLKYLIYFGVYLNE